MKIGLLNELTIPKMTYCMEDGTIPTASESGNLLEGQRILIDWKQVMEGSLFLGVSLGTACFVSALSLTLGEEGKPLRVTVWDREKTRVLYRHTAETGMVIQQKELTLTIGETLEEFVIELEYSFSSPDLLDLKIYGSDAEIPALFPIPASFRSLEGTLPTSVLSTHNAQGLIALEAVAVISERICEELGFSPVHASDAYFSLLTDSTLAQNAYHLCVSTDGVRLFAADLRGFIIGAEALLKLVKNGNIPCCEIEDAPYMPFRGVHIYLPGPEEMEFAKRLIRHVVSPMGYNAVILEIAGGMRFDSHPEITAAVLEAKERARNKEWPPYPHGNVGGRGVTEKKDAADFANYVRRFGIDVIPEVQSLGHVQFMTVAHPEIAERDENATEATVNELAADVPPKLFYPHCYCPSNESSYEILFDLMDEIIDVIRPTSFVHIGHDEVYQIGVCPKCAGKDPARLFANDVLRIYEYLKKKKLRTMMWADMLQPVTHYLTPPAIDLLPKDILMLDFIWYFHMDKDIEDALLEKGYPVAYGNLYSSHFPRFETRIAKTGIVGGEISAWVGTNEYDFGKEGKLYDFIHTAQLLWSASYDHRLRLVYDRKIKDMIPRIRMALRGESPMQGNEKILLFTPSLPPYSPKDSATVVNVNDISKALIFTSVTSKMLNRIPWIELDTLGTYRIVYEDGGSIELPIRYGEGVGYWARRQNAPLMASYYRHNGYFSTYFADGIEGKLPDGTPYTLYRWEWKNPEPLRRISHVELHQNGEQPTSVVWLGLSNISDT